MSQSPSSPSPSDSDTLGSRENFFDVENGGYQPTDADEETVGHVEKPGITWESYVAGTILRQNPDADLYCPVCAYELPEDQQRHVRLSDPEDYVPPAEVERQRERRTPDGDSELIEWTETRYTDHRRHRYCPECSTIVWGGILSDVPRESFLAVVDEVLAAVGHVPPGRKRDLRDAADARKQKGVSDQSNVEQLLVELEHGLDD